MAKRIEHPLVRSYRELLRVEPGASVEDVKHAFRDMARVYHPDTNPDVTAQSVFVRIREAYEVLSSAERVQAMNREYLRHRVTARCVQGFPLQVGALFGHRQPGARNLPDDVEEAGWGQPRRVFHVDMSGNRVADPDEAGDASILDDPQLDLVEVIFAGQMAVRDETLLLDAFRRRDFSRLPWFVLNNEGVVRFLERDFPTALLCYDTLNDRIPDNVVFLYRLGLCHEITSFEKRRRVFPSGQVRLEPRHVRKALRCYRRAIDLASSRPYLPQRCLTVRKMLAELLEWSGRRWQSWRAWQHIHGMEPANVEAATHEQLTRPRAVALLAAAQE